MQKWGKAVFTSAIEGGVWVPIGRMIMFENRHEKSDRATALSIYLFAE